MRSIGCPASPSSQRLGLRVQRPLDHPWKRPPRRCRPSGWWGHRRCDPRPPRRTTATIPDRSRNERLAYIVAILDRPKDDGTMSQAVGVMLSRSSVVPEGRPPLRYLDGGSHRLRVAILGRPEGRPPPSGRPRITTAGVACSVELHSHGSRPPGQPRIALPGDASHTSLTTFRHRSPRRDVRGVGTPFRRGGGSPEPAARPRRRTYGRLLAYEAAGPEGWLPGRVASARWIASSGRARLGDGARLCAINADALS